jgi:hypothetical protein
MRWTRFGGWLIAVGMMMLPLSSALAAPVMVVGTFQENFLGGGGDTFTIMNAASSATGILTVRYNLAPSQQASFDPGDDPFRVVSGGMATGFNGMFNATRTSLTLNFTDFDPGETFSFRVDVDDNIGSRSGATSRTRSSRSRSTPRRPIPPWQRFVVPTCGDWDPRQRRCVQTSESTCLSLARRDSCCSA